MIYISCGHNNNNNNTNNKPQVFIIFAILNYEILIDRLIIYFIEIHKIISIFILRGRRIFGVSVTVKSIAISIG